jgi:hypothetical protein
MLNDQEKAMVEAMPPEYRDAFRRGLIEVKTAVGDYVADKTETLPPGLYQDVMHCASTIASVWGIPHDRFKAALIVFDMLAISWCASRILKEDRWPDLDLLKAEIKKIMDNGGSL